MITVDTIRNAFLEIQPKACAELYKAVGAEDKVAERKVRKLLQRLKNQGEVTLCDRFIVQNKGGLTIAAKTRNWCLTDKGRSRIRPTCAKKSEELPAYTKVWRVVRGLGSHGKIFTVSDVATIAEVPLFDAMTSIFMLIAMGYIEVSNGGYKAAFRCQESPNEPQPSQALKLLESLLDSLAKAAKYYL